MGGHAAGEIASEIVVRTLDELAPRSIDVDGLTNAIEAANLNVIKAPKQGIAALAWEPPVRLPSWKTHVF